MKITRLYTGSDQKSYFEDIELEFGGEQKILTTDPRPAKMVAFRSVAPGTVLERHTAPRRQFLVTLSGSWEIEASDGAVKSFKTGDVMLADDITGEGHISRVVGDKPHIFMTVPLAE
jgi:hypothetical protein